MQSKSYRLKNGLSLERVDFTPLSEVTLTPKMHRNLDLAVRRLELKYGVRQRFVSEQVFAPKSKLKND